MATQTFIHLSDLHIGPKRGEMKQAEHLIARIASSHPNIPVLITGDVVNSGNKEKQCIAARAVLDRLAETNPVLTVPGNHDYAWIGNVMQPKALRNWARHLSSPLGWNRAPVNWLENKNEPKNVDGLGVWKAGECMIFGVDSGDPKDKVHTARGYISKGLATGLKKSLIKYKDSTRIVFLHHHPFTDGAFTKLIGADLLMEAIQGNCDLLLFGHHHKYGIWRAKVGIPLIVASHKSTEKLSGDCLAFTVIDIAKVGTPAVSFRHRLVMA